jgi:hypothetical protein
MLWKYRYVNFGTDFRSVAGTRHAIEDGPSTRLYENELVVDVGAACFGHNGETRWIIDHHFKRDHQFPCASAGVIHKAAHIRERYRPIAESGEPIWLVSHRQPDFDAFCSMYLARHAIEATGSLDWRQQGIHPEAWIPAILPQGDEIPRIDWYRPDLRGISAEQRWKILLASFASHIDNCRKMAAPKARSLHSILYAAVERGRDYKNENNGATEFFDEVVKQMSEGLNPLFDSVLENSSKFAPELAMLDREIDTYQRDIKRSRRVIVTVQRHPRFDEEFKKVSATPLLDAQHNPQKKHLGIYTERRHVDGIYIRDPECLLFKEWAREDIPNSSYGRGFLFTAVAYSRGRPEAPVNTTDYVFSLDPEKADGTHLYNVWARLQAREIAALRSDPENAPPPNANPRPEYQPRAGAEPALFADPWYDGQTYSGTIIGTPNRGTVIGSSGVLHDLSDDPIAAIVRNEIELSIFTSDVCVFDAPTRPGLSPQKFTNKLADALEQPQSPVNLHLRYVEVEVDDNTVLLQGGVSQQVGRVLWRILNAEDGVPTDFTENHLITSLQWVAIWSRHGVGVGFRGSAAGEIKALRTSFEQMAALSTEMYTFLDPQPDVDPAQNVRLGDTLIRRHVQLKHDLATPGARVLRRFLESVRMDQALATLRDVNASSAEQLRQKLIDRQNEHLIEQNAHMLEQSKHQLKSTETIAAVQTKVEWLEIFFVGIYATEMTRTITEFLGVRRNLAAVFTIAAAAIFTVAAAFVLQPWKHIEKAQKPRALVFVILMIALWLLGIVGSIKLPEWMREVHGSEPVSGVQSDPF